MAALLERGLPIAVAIADRPCRALDVAREGGTAAELVERTDFGPDFDRVAYTDYVYVEELHECKQMVEDLGDKPALVMRNHGLLTVGRSIAEAFVLMHYLDRACEIHVEALATGQPLRVPPRAVCEDAARRYWTWYKGDHFGQLDWDALVRRLDADDPSYHR